MFMLVFLQKIFFPSVMGNKPDIIQNYLTDHYNTIVGYVKSTISLLHKLM